MNSILNWLGQTSTIAGMTAIGGSVTSILSGALTWQVALPVAVGGVISALMPQNPTVAKVGQAVTGDLIALAGQLVPAAAPAVTPVATPAPAPAPATSLDTLAAAVATHVVAKMAAAPVTHGMGAP